MVKVSPTQKVRGHIREIQENYFVIQPDGQTETIDVPYSSVWKINKNLSFGATVAIVVGIAAAVVLILVLSGEDEVDVLPNYYRTSASPGKSILSRGLLEVLYKVTMG
jgi:hypothetical protein